MLTELTLFLPTTGATPSWDDYLANSIYKSQRIDYFRGDSCEIAKFESGQLEAVISYNTAVVLKLLCTPKQKIRFVYNFSKTKCIY
jgi:hypothetical protein